MSLIIETGIAREPGVLELDHSVLELVLDATNTGLWTWDVATDVVRWSPETFRIHDLTPAQFDGTGVAFFRLVHSDDQARVRESVTGAIRTHQMYSEEFRILRPDGSVRWVMNRGRASYDAEGAPAVVVGTITDVTERHLQAETVRLEAEAHFRASFESAAIGFASIAPDGRILHANRAFQRLAARSVEALRAIEYPQLVHEVDRERVAALLSALSSGKSSDFVVETRYVDGGQGPVWVRQSAAVVPKGDAVGWISLLVEDVTQRRLTEESLTRTKELFETALAASPVTVFSQDTDLRYTWIHNCALGLPSAHVIGKRDAEILPRAEDAALVEGIKRAVLETGEGRRGEVHVWRNARERRVYDVLVQAQRDSRGRVVGVVGAALDLTDRQEFERALDRANERLREATLAGGLGVHEYDPAAEQLVWDRRMRDWWGLTEDEPVTYDKFIARLHPDDRATMQAAVDRALDPVLGGRYDAQYRVLHPDGTTRWMRATGAVTFLEERPVRLVGTVQDITADVTLHAKLIEADRRKDVFLATLSHELRNPLAPIRTAAKLLGNARVDDEKTAFARAVIQRQVEHLSGLLDDLLDVARIAQGKLTLRRQPVSLAAAVEAAVEAARPLLDRKRHQLSIALPDPTPLLDADALRVSQILSNLLTNAAKYTDAGGRIDVLAEVTGESTIRIRVRDDGIGISRDALTRVFEMFAQSEGAAERAEGGLGIGLALVKTLVELHGGGIEATSEGPGRGSTFSVSLPIASGG